MIVATKVKEPEKLCLWCAHHFMQMQQPGYSEFTPSTDFQMGCTKNHWQFDRYDSEEHYRACILTAAVCKDYMFNPELICAAPELKP